MFTAVPAVEETTLLLDASVVKSLEDAIVFWGDAACDFLVEILQGAINHHDETSAKLGWSTNVPSPLLYTVYRVSLDHLHRLKPDDAVLPLCDLADLVVDAARRLGIYDTLVCEAGALPRTLRVSIAFRVAWSEVVDTEAVLREVGREAQQHQRQHPGGCVDVVTRDATNRNTAVASVVFATFDACFADWYLEFFSDAECVDDGMRRALVKCWRLVNSMYNTCVKVLRYLPYSEDLATYVHVLVGAKSRADSRLVDAGVDIPPTIWCHNVACSNLEGDSDLGVRTKMCGCQCYTGGQCTRRYCSDRCHGDAWPAQMRESSI
jgi:hypothetical protein